MNHLVWRIHTDLELSLRQRPPYIDDDALVAITSVATTAHHNGRAISAVDLWACVSRTGAGTALAAAGVDPYDVLFVMVHGAPPQDLALVTAHDVESSCETTPIRPSASSRPSSARPSASRSSSLPSARPTSRRQGQWSSLGSRSPRPAIASSLLARSRVTTAIRCGSASTTARSPRIASTHRAAAGPLTGFRSRYKLGSSGVATACLPQVKRSRRRRACRVRRSQ
jgi:hypothetical protein